MFSKLMASVGIGAAKVDTIIHTERLYPGQPFDIEIVIEGGKVDQQINGLTLALMVQAEVESGDHEGLQSLVLHDWHLNESFTIGAGEIVRDSFQLQLPLETPLTLLPRCRNQTHVWLQTGLDIASGVDGSDKDFLPVAPVPAMSNVMAAIEGLGFALYSADVEKGQLRGSGFYSTLGCYQELEYRPASFGNIAIKELELSFVLADNALHLLVEVDRHFRGDGFTSLTLPLTVSIEQAATALRQALRL
ncbi:sporulation protein [Ferrimonas senticii]|uniref:sporulation protein n=1 Tax=Ferrimonas senticii TaxID=394566 RepID=UPI0004010509|nr:sporulation protein [Ferrimonas senticii]